MAIILSGSAELASFSQHPPDMIAGGADAHYQFSYWGPRTPEDTALAASFHTSGANPGKDSAWLTQTESLAKSVIENTALSALTEYLEFRATLHEQREQDGESVITANFQMPHPTLVNKKLRRLPLARERRPARLAICQGQFSPKQEADALQNDSFIIGLDVTEEREGRTIVTNPTLMHDMGIHAVFGYLLTSPWYRKALKQEFQANPDETSTTIIADRIDMHLNYVKTGQYLNQLLQPESSPSYIGNQEAKQELLVELGRCILAPFNKYTFTDKEAEAWGQDMVDQCTAMLRAIDVINKQGRVVAAFRKIFAPVR